MNEPLERDPLEPLRAADPVDVDDLPSASLARIRARVREDVMTSTVPTRRPSRARLLGLGLGAAAIATLVLIIVVGRPGAAPGVQPGSPAGSGLAGSSPAGSGLAGSSPAGSVQPVGLAGSSSAGSGLAGSSPAAGSPTGGLEPGGLAGSGVSASCVEPYDGPASVARRGLAFDGTVTTIDGDQVTFTVNAWYRGAGGATITLDATGMTGSAITSAGGPNLTVGERYLVAGEDQFAWACGYTQPYDPAIAARWAAAVRG